MEKPSYFLWDLKLYEREIVALDIIKDFDWAPKVVGIMPESRAIVMEDAGERISSKNVPDDAIDQVNRIFDDLESIKLHHDDLRTQELLVKDGKITLCDWGWCSTWVDEIGGERDPSLGGHEGICKNIKFLHESMTREQVIEDIIKMMNK